MRLYNNNISFLLPATVDLLFLRHYMLLIFVVLNSWPIAIFSSSNFLTTSFSTRWRWPFSQTLVSEPSSFILNIYIYIYIASFLVRLLRRSFLFLSPLLGGCYFSFSSCQLHLWKSYNSSYEKKKGKGRVLNHQLLQVSITKWILTPKTTVPWPE